MPVNIPRLRLWFATAAILLAAVVAGVYFYGRLRVRRAVKEIPKQLGVNIQQSTQGFTLSKSEAGHTLFTIHAARAVQYKQGGKAELRDVNIIVYGREANRYDQIYGSEFDYDPQSGNVNANGVVHIDLEGNAEGPINPDQAPPPELKNPIHVKTSGLSFNAKTGLASTKDVVEFRVPQASGSAVGATYDSKAATLILLSNIVLHSPDNATTMTARHGAITKGPNRAVLDGVHIAGVNGTFASDQLTVYLRDDNTLERFLATGDVHAGAKGKSPTEVIAPRAEAWLTPNNALKSAVFSGGVQLSSSGRQAMQGTAGRVALDFAAQNKVNKIVASDGVKLLQQSTRNDRSHPVQIAASAIDFAVRNGRVLQQATTSGPAQLTVLPAHGASGQDAGETVATAGHFQARFNRQNRIDQVVGEPDAKVVLSNPGQPDKTSTSDRLQVAFNPSGGIGAILQDGHFHYSEPAAAGQVERAAWADHARYNPADETLSLSGSPRVVDGGITTTADTIRLERRSGDAFANGNVKSTYSELKPQAGGALLASGDPIHVTATAMRAAKVSGIAIYSGGARLWQAANVIEAPVLEFNRQDRSLIAKSFTPGAKGSVNTSFVQQDKNGKVTPVSIRSAQLNYRDADRHARFDGGVTLNSAGTVITAKTVDVYLNPNGQRAAATAAGPSEINKIVAEGGVTIRQPNRRAEGEKLVYTAASGSFVLTGGPPSIFDAEHGKITGGSLTFYNRDDRVVVESTDSSPTVTQTRIAK